MMSKKRVATCCESDRSRSLHRRSKGTCGRYPIGMKKKEDCLSL